MFDKVELVNYSVLLSYPNTSNPNSLQLLDGKGQLLYDAHTKQEPPLTIGEDDPNVAPPFNAYSGSGKVTVSLCDAILLTFTLIAKLMLFLILYNSYACKLSCIPMSL